MNRVPRSLVDLARERALRQPQRGYRFLGDGARVTDALSYAALDREARALAVAIRETGAARGDRVVVVHAAGLDFVRSLWACFYAGLVAVPAPPPIPTKLKRTLGRLRAIVRDCDAALVVTSSTVAEAEHTRDALAADPELSGRRWLAIDRVSSQAGADADAWRDPNASPDDIALLQYTSGSTQAPRGVVLTHANLLHNLELLRRFHLDQEHIVMVHWLPLYHDMGLIRGTLSPLHMGGDCVMLSPMNFVQRPSRWFAAVSAHGGTTTGAPNFGYDLAARAVSDSETEGLDLSSLRVAFSSAEPIRSATVERFIARFAKSGFRREAFRPAYGLAEATVAVAGELGPGPVTYAVEDHDARGVVERVTCGTPLGDQEVVIVGDDTRLCAGGHVGEIWIRGGSVGQGYFRKPALTAEVFGARLADGTGPYLRTGDLGCFAPDGRLVVTGRRKDLVIVRGQNHYAHEIEATVDSGCSLVRVGCTAAFPIDVDGTEEVAIMCEPAGEPDGAPWAELVNAVRSAVAEEHDLAVHVVCVVGRGQTPKTASGKIQRELARRAWIDGEVAPLHVWSANARSNRLR